MNVGGRQFVTTRSVLCSDPHSRLARMFGASALSGPTEVLARDAQGVVYLDRDPDYFACVLNFLRTRKVLMNRHVTIEGVLAEADYFEIRAMRDSINVIAMGRTQYATLMMEPAANMGSFMFARGPFEPALFTELNGGTIPPAHFSHDTRVYGNATTGWYTFIIAIHLLILFVGW